MGEETQLGEGKWFLPVLQASFQTQRFIYVLFSYIFYFQQPALLVLFHIEDPVFLNLQPKTPPKFCFNSHNPNAKP